MNASVFALPSLSEARERLLGMAIHEQQAWAKRAKVPEEKVALAEIEQELINIREKWKSQGLILSEPQLQEVGS